MKIVRSIVVAMTLAAIAVPATVLAQSADASLRGRAPVNSEVTARNVATGLVRHAKVGADGTYFVSGLPPGTYRVDAGAGTEQVVAAPSASTATWIWAPEAG